MLREWGALRLSTRQFGLASLSEALLEHLQGSIREGDMDVSAIQFSSVQGSRRDPKAQIYKWSATQTSNGEMLCPCMCKYVVMFRR